MQKKDIYKSVLKIIIKHKILYGGLKMKRLNIITITILITLILGISIYLGINFIKDKEVSSQVEEYVPQEEISEEQMRRTIVSLYFYNNETGELERESRLIDTNDLLDEPYIKLVKMLIDGPKNNKLKSLMPEDVNIYSANLENNCVTVNMSSEFLNHTEDDDLKYKMIYSIVNTLTELIEVDSVKFLVEGEENAEFNGEYVRIT